PVAHCSRLDVVKVVARLPLGVGEAQNKAAVDDLRNEIGALLGAAAMTKKAAAEHNRRQIWFEHQGAAKSLHRDHRLHGAASRAAVLLIERESEKTEFGELRPHIAAPAFGVLAVALALLEGVKVADQAIEALFQQP